MPGTNTIEELISTLYEMVQDAFSVPLSGDRCVVEREKVLDILDEVRANMPSDFRMAKEIVENRNKLIVGARTEAESIKQSAQEEAKRLVNDSDILLEARKKAAETIAAAEARAKEISDVSYQYCDDLMKRAEEALAQAHIEMKNSRVNFKSAIKDQR